MMCTCGMVMSAQDWVPGWMCSMREVALSRLEIAVLIVVLLTVAEAPSGTTASGGA